MSIKKKIATYLSALSLLPLTQAAYAGNVEIVNKNTKELTIKIKAEGPDKSKIVTYKIVVPAEGKFTFPVNKDLLVIKDSAVDDKKLSYSVKGDTSAVTPGSACDELKLDKDYVLSFEDDSMGTTCKVQERAAQ